MPPWKGRRAICSRACPPRASPWLAPRRGPPPAAGRGREGGGPAYAGLAHLFKPSQVRLRAVGGIGVRSAVQTVSRDAGSAEAEHSVRRGQSCGHYGAEFRSIRPCRPRPRHYHPGQAPRRRLEGDAQQSSRPVTTAAIPTAVIACFQGGLVTARPLLAHRAGFATSDRSGVAVSGPPDGMRGCGAGFELAQHGSAPQWSAGFAVAGG